MANKYKYPSNVIDVLIEEEDREVSNDCLRAKTAYYTTLNEINKIYLNTLKNMSTEEIKQSLTCKNIVIRNMK